jgi:hypothetical protein
VTFCGAKKSIDVQLTPRTVSLPKNIFITATKKNTEQAATMLGLQRPLTFAQNGLETSRTEVTVELEGGQY